MSGSLGIENDHEALTPWTGGLDPLMVAYNESIYFDRALYRQDILGSIAFARANCKSGILTKAEFEKIEKGLLEVEKEWASGSFKIMPGVDEGLLSHTTGEAHDSLLL